MSNSGIRDALNAAACKVCNSGCIAGFECGKSKADWGRLPLFGSNTVCPLQKYEVEHTDKGKTLIERLRNTPELEELDLLCQHCDFRDKSKDTPETFSLESCFVSHCMDCPVESCRENIEETIAEARMS